MRLPKYITKAIYNKVAKTELSWINYVQGVEVQRGTEIKIPSGINVVRQTTLFDHMQMIFRLLQHEISPVRTLANYYKL